jgi:hypothetical protein
VFWGGGGEGGVFRKERQGERKGGGFRESQGVCAGERGWGEDYDGKDADGHGEAYGEGCGVLRGTNHQDYYDFFYEVYLQFFFIIMTITCRL